MAGQVQDCVGVVPRRGIFLKAVAEPGEVPPCERTLTSLSDHLVKAAHAIMVPHLVRLARWRSVDERLILLAVTGAQIPVPGSAAAMATSEAVIEVSLILRPRQDVQCPSPDEVGGQPVAEGHHIDRALLGSLRGAHPDEVAAVIRWATGRGLAVIGSAPERRAIRITGALTGIAAAFNADLRVDSGVSPQNRRLAATPELPDELRNIVVAVLGLETGPFVPPRLRRLPLPDPSIPLSQAAPLSFEPPTIAQLYRYPDSTSARGRSIGLLELGGGYNQQDLASYFAALGMAPPELVAIPVDGGSNQPTGDPNGPDGEVTLDIEVAGSIAPGARIAVYFAPNTDQGFLAAILEAVHDRINSPCVLSISWGGPEANWPAPTIAAFEQAFQDAALVGMTVCVAAGDNGSSDGLSDGLAHVDFPAASPHVLACGGTRLQASGGEISSEAAWNDQPLDGATGGGVSALFPIPSWQPPATVPSSVNPGHFRGRGVPDVGGDADPATGYRILVDGEAAVFGGTSAVAPLWAALIAICVGALGKEIGYLNPLLYQTLVAKGITRDITQGTNGAYSAGPGWDPCTGWGSPVGESLLSSLQG